VTGVQTCALPICVSRKVFDALSLSAPSYRNEETGDIELDYFRARAVNGKYQSEDYHFCIQARTAGFQVFADPSLSLRHSGQAVWPLPGQLTANKEKTNGSIRE